ncbi:MAG: pyridoxamine 5'-phosphate oxidase family protein [Rhodospirillales bacterium]|nr:pyridoxamine 5'-phosphate oxidase family protein [Rhodospirillales bacterium]
MSEITPAWQARRLLRAARSATLASSAEGQPFASLVTPATTADLGLLLLLSDLSEHTRHLRADPRCALLVCGDAEGPNPQTAPRLTVTGLAERVADPALKPRYLAVHPYAAERVADPALKARYLAVHPYAALYADFGDFAIWRVRPMGGLLVGGFARATRLRGSELAPDAAAVAAIEAAAAGIMGHCNDDHPDALAAIAGGDGPWRMVGVDVDGCDLSDGEATRHIAWPEQVADPGGVRAALVAVTRAARAAKAAGSNGG